MVEWADFDGKNTVALRISSILARREVEIMSNGSMSRRGRAEWAPAEEKPRVAVTRWSGRVGDLAEHRLAAAKQK